MTDDEAIQLALQHYRTTWFTAWAARDDDGTSWTGAVVTEWQTEYDTQSALGLAEAKITNANFEGGSAGGIDNFSAGLRLRALQLFRAELQPTYAAILVPPTRRPVQRAGLSLRFSPC